MFDISGGRASDGIMIVSRVNIAALASFLRKYAGFTRIPE
jgi:hypothetical protein